MIERLVPCVRDIRRFGSAALDLTWTAAGRFDAYYERSVKQWDIAAGALICERAGLEITSCSPREPSLGHPRRATGARRAAARADRRAMRRLVNSARQEPAAGRHVARGHRGCAAASNPQHIGPRPAEHPDCMRVIAAPLAGPAVDVLGPRMPVARAVGQHGHVCSQALVTRPAEAGGRTLARLDRDRGLAGVGGQRVARGVARPVIADLGQQAGCADHALWIAEQAQEDLPVGVAAHGAGDLAGELADLLDDRLKRRDQAEHGRSPRVCRNLPMLARGALCNRPSSSPGDLRPQ